MYVCIEQETLHKIYNFPNTDIQTILIPFPIHIPISNFRLSFLSSSSFFFKQMLKCFLSQVAFFFPLSKGKKITISSLFIPLSRCSQEKRSPANETKALCICVRVHERLVCTRIHTYGNIYHIHIIFIFIYIYMYVQVNV